MNVIISIEIENILNFQIFDMLHFHFNFFVEMFSLLIYLILKH